MEQLAPIDECQNEVKFLRRLKGELQGYNKRIIDLSQNGSFCKRVVDLRTRNNMSFTDSLESVNSLSVTLPTLHISKVQGGGKGVRRMKIRELT